MLLFSEKCIDKNEFMFKKTCRVTALTEDSIFFQVWHGALYYIFLIPLNTLRMIWSRTNRTIPMSLKENVIF